MGTRRNESFSESRLLVRRFVAVGLSAVVVGLVAVPVVFAEEASSFVAGPDPAVTWAWRAPRWSGYEKADQFYLGVARSVAGDWKASYGLILPGDEGKAVPGWSALRVDAPGFRDWDGAYRNPDNWKHFVGLEYTGVEGFTFLGGLAKSTVKGNWGQTPIGYEGLRLNTGARWRGESWGLEGHFAWIPGGTRRIPPDVVSFPGGRASTGPAYLFSVTLSRRF